MKARCLYPGGESIIAALYSRRIPGANTAGQKAKIFFNDRAELSSDYCRHNHFHLYFWLRLFG